MLFKYHAPLMPNLYNRDEDSLLLTQLRDGNRFAFDALYKKYWSFVFNSAYKRLKDMTLAEDVTQDVFERLWLGAETYHINDLPNYLFIATRNRVIRLLEREQRLIAVPEILEHLQTKVESADAHLLYEELKLAYEAVVAKLTQQQQLIFRLKYLQDFSADQIAEQLMLSPKTVRNQLGIINNKLRTSITLVQMLLVFHLFV